MPTRKPSRCLVALLACAVLAASARASDAAAVPPPAGVFFSRAQYGNVVLSPSGRYLAVVVPNGEQYALAIVDVDTREMTAKMGAYDDDVLNVRWLSDERLIVVHGDPRRVAGEPARPLGAIAVNRDGSRTRNLPGTFLRTLPGTTDVLVTAYGRSPRSLDLYRVDTLSGAKTLLSYDAPGNVSRWVVDFDGLPRALVADDIEHDTSAWYAKKRGGTEWTKVAEAKSHLLPSTPLAFDAEGRLLYVAARRDGADRAAIYEYDVEAGAWGNAVVRHPERDLDAGSVFFVGDFRARKLLGVRYADDRSSVVWFDAQRASVQKSVDAALPDTVNTIQGTSDGRRFVVVASSDRNPGEAFLLDGATMRMEKLFSYRPWLDPRRMAATRWVRYAARDGLSIPALLTVPADAHGKPVPLVVLIHGGPYVQATAWGFHPEVQFLASRGYAVLEPQFRGTRGFGWKHLSSGYRKWGDEMQDDLEDGVRFAVSEGIADASRVCFYGGSYGGYAAIWASIKTPTLIRCAVAFVAVTSLDYLFDNAQTDLAYYVDRSSAPAEMVGDPKAERARFKRVSPLEHADQVGAPLLLAYGGADRRVPLAHGVDFRAALDKYRKPYEWVQYPDEGHGFRREQDVLDFYRRVEAFLAKHLDEAPPKN